MTVGHIWPAGKITERVRSTTACRERTIVKGVRRDFNFILGICLVALVFLPVLVGFVWTPYEPSAMDITAKSMPPSLSHWFGTDYFGRDVFSRVMEGARMTFLVGAASIAIGAGIGIFVGALTGYFGGPLDELLMRVNDGLASFPSVLLALVLVSVFGSGKYMIIVALGIVFIPSFARVARSEFIAQKERDYVKNAKLMGAGALRIMFVHILPNTRGILLSAVTIGFNNAVLAEAGLSYLGIGTQPTDVSLGRMLAEAQGYLMKAPWFALAPGLTIVLTVLGFSLISESLGKTGAVRKAVKKVKHKSSRPVNAKSGDAKDKTADVTEEGAGQSVGVINGKESVVGRGTETVSSGDTVLEPRLADDILLRAEHMTVAFHEDGEWDEVVKDANFTIRKGEILGVVGESGSGKSMTALAVMGLLKEHGRITQGRLFFDDKELTTLSPEEYRALRGCEMSMVFQEPMTSLNPVFTVGKQMEEMLKLHPEFLLSEAADTEQSGGTDESIQPMNRKANDRKEMYKRVVLQALRDAGLKEPEQLYGKYPHELSGGMRQRVMIAMAMILRPKLLIADEPTTALDATIQAKILKLLKEINEKHGISILFISHDLNIIRRMCDRVIVMCKGEMVEQGSVRQIFEAPQQDYTKKLLHAALGELGGIAEKEQPNQQCVVSEREEIKSAGAAETLEKGQTAGESENVSVKSGHIIELDGVNVFYKEKKKRLFGPEGRKHAVKDVTLHVREGEILGIVGESGCGKSSLAKAIVGLQAQVEGEIRLGTGTPQMVFQDPYGSLNPSKRIGWLLQEPLRLACPEMTEEEREKRVDEILTKVDLPLRYKKRFPSELSGGQRQRVAIALALVLNRNLIVLDEPVSALDVTVQEQILELLLRLRREEGLSYIFISHDMQVIRRVCDYVCVMYQGEIVENAKTEQIFETPQHAYTKKLIEAALY